MRVLWLALFATSTLAQTPWTCPQHFTPICSYLQQFYEALDGENWARNDGWSHASAGLVSESWFGLGCSTHKVLTKMVLPSNNLRGNLPAVLQNLTTLRKIELGSNHLSGLFPDFSAFGVLQAVDLSNNTMDGPLPDSFSNIKKLRVLNVGHNSFSRRFPEMPPETGFRETYPTSGRLLSLTSPTTTSRA